MKYEFTKEEMSMLWLATYSYRKFMDLEDRYASKTKNRYTRLSKKIDKLQYQED